MIAVLITYLVMASGLSVMAWGYLFRKGKHMTPQFHVAVRELRKAITNLEVADSRREVEEALAYGKRQLVEAGELARDAFPSGE